MSHPSATPLPLPTAAGFSHAEQAADHWQNSLLRRMVLAERKTVKLDRVTFLQFLAVHDTPEQVVASIVAMFTDTGEQFG